MLVALAVGALLGVAPFATLAWNPRGLAAGIVATAPLLLLLRWCLHTRVAPIARLVRLVMERVAPLFAGSSAGHRRARRRTRGRRRGGAVSRRRADRAARAPLPVGRRRGHGGAVRPRAFLTAAYALLAALVGAYLGWLHLASGNLLVPIVDPRAVRSRCPPAPPRRETDALLLRPLRRSGPPAFPRDAHTTRRDPDAR